MCPARGGLICPACCGSKRGSELVCPPDCPYFPFGVLNYDLFLKIDGDWNKKAAVLLHEKLGEGGMRDLWDQAMQDAGTPECEEAIPFHHLAIHKKLFVERDRKGITAAERWLEGQGPALTNDERVLMRYRKDAFPTVIEVQRVRDGLAVECVDLLDPEHKPFVMFDRGTAQQASRFSRILTWICRYPHFTRPGPIAIMIPDSICADFPAALGQLAKKRFTRRDTYSAKEVLRENFPECCKMMLEMSANKIHRMVRSADLKHCRAIYEIVGDRNAIRAILDEKPDFEPSEDKRDTDDPAGTLYYDWVRRGESKSIERRMPVYFRFGKKDRGVGGLAKIKLLPHSLIIETLSEKKFTFAVKMLKKYFGDMLSSRGTTVEDLGEKVLERLAHPREDRIESADDNFEARIPRDELNKAHQAHSDQMYRKFLDDRIPMLGDVTPREASKRPEMREQLKELLKIHLRGIYRRNKLDGLHLNIDWVIRELGMEELL